MHFLLRSISASLRHTHHQNHRTLYDSAASIKWVRDRGLDHAVLREKNLKPVLNLKNLIKSEPSKSLPLSIITSSKDSLQIPTRPIEFIRKYPSIFEEFFPGNVTIHPHIKLSSQALNLDAEENILYQSVSYKQDLADRLLKLLMIGRINKIPLGVLDRVKWELGLPQDYVKSIVPEFPDYFTVSKGNLGGNDEMLELVCWSNELAVSAIEKKGKEVGGVRKGASVEFPLKYTQGFEMDKKYKKWVDEWQKLPYISPYENIMHLAPRSDESDKWAVAVLHEILNLFVGKKAEKESVLCLGEVFGLRSRFKSALLQHPGIFYVSSKNWTHTAVLRDCYKRGMLIEKDMLMDMRFKYARLMNTMKEGDKGRGIQQKAGHEPKEGEREEVESNLGDEEEDEEMHDLSNEDTDGDYEDDDDDGEEDYDDESAKNRGRQSNKTTFEAKKSSRNVLRSSAGGNPSKTLDRTHQRFSRRSDRDGQNARGRSRERLDLPRYRGRSNIDRSTST